MSFRLPPADHPAVKLLVQVADVAVGNINGGAILLPPKPVEVATVPDMQMVLEKAVVPTAVQLGRLFQESCLRNVFFPRF